MPRRIGARTRAALMHDLIHADFDLTDLRSKYNLSPDHLADWVHDDANRRCLAGLCVLADIQTQLLLSRYRLIAAGRLYELATHRQEDTKAAQDTARRACVDLLKLELRRADTRLSDTNGPAQGEPTSPLHALYGLLQHDTDHGPQEEHVDEVQDADTDQD